MRGNVRGFQTSSRIQIAYQLLTGFHAKLQVSTTLEVARKKAEHGVSGSLRFGHWKVISEMRSKHLPTRFVLAGAK